MDLIEKKPEPGTEGEKSKPSGNITDVLEEPVHKEEAGPAPEINKSDFAVDSLEIKPVAEKKAEDKKVEAPGAEKKKEEIVNVAKQKAVTRLFKPQTFLLLTNNLLGKAGKTFKPKNPEFLKFTKPDREDLGIILQDTVEEENWSGIKAKYLLIFFLIVHLTTCIWNMNKPAAKLEEENSAGKLDPSAPALEKMLAEFKQQQEQTNLYIEELRQQNRLLQGLMDKKIERDPAKKAPGAKKGPERFYKNIDLESVQFTENGARIFPDQAGQPGYGPTGAKHGKISNDDKDLFFVWKRYQEFKAEELEV